MAGTQSNIELVVAGIRQALDDSIKEVAFAIMEELIVANPVDTGWSRANWIVSIGSPRDQPYGTRESVSDFAQAHSQGQLLVYDTKQGNIFINNNVPYITELNQGKSKQAPAGFVEQCIDRGIQTAAAMGPSV